MRQMNRNWSAPETLEPILHSNEFGEVVFEPVTDYMPVSEITVDNVPEINDVLVSIDCAEQVTLITENRRGCMSFLFPFPEGTDKFNFGLQYSCPSRAAVCRVTINRFQTPNGLSARQQIEDMAPKTIGPLPV